MVNQPNRNRIIGREASKGFRLRLRTNFWLRFAPAPGLDIGYRGDIAGAKSILPDFTGIELGDPGYDGFHLPYDDGQFNCVHSSHVLEHVPSAVAALKEWWRVLAVNGSMIVIVPHAFLYERRVTVPPSRWSPEHLCSFTPASLLDLVEIALVPNTYRIAHLRDVDEGYRYDLPPTVHPEGNFEIELVLVKRDPPTWSVEP
jgi:SAM-dependent methyltransferase